MADGLVQGVRVLEVMASCPSRNHMTANTLNHHQIIQTLTMMTMTMMMMTSKEVEEQSLPPAMLKLLLAVSHQVMSSKDW